MRRSVTVCVVKITIACLLSVNLEVTPSPFHVVTLLSSLGPLHDIFLQTLLRHISLELSD
jgi:hypothetical protein